MTHPYLNPRQRQVSQKNSPQLAKNPQLKPSGQSNSSKKDGDFFQQLIDECRARNSCGQ